MSAKRGIVIIVVMITIIESNYLQALDIRAWPAAKKDYLASEEYREDRQHNESDRHIYPLLEKYTDTEKQNLQKSIDLAKLILSLAVRSIESKNVNSIKIVNNAIERWIGPPGLLLNDTKLAQTRAKLTSLIGYLNNSKDIIVAVPLVMGTKITPHLSTSSASSSAAESADTSGGPSGRNFLSETAPSPKSSSASSSVSTPPDPLRVPPSIQRLNLVYKPAFKLTYDKTGDLKNVHWIALAPRVFYYENGRKEITEKLEEIQKEIKQAKYFININDDYFFHDTLSYPDYYAAIASASKRALIKRLVNSLETFNINRALTLLHECSHIILGTYDLEIEKKVFSSPENTKKVNESLIEKLYTDMDFDLTSMTYIGGMVSDKKFDCQAPEIIHLYKDYFLDSAKLKITLGKAFETIIKEKPRSVMFSDGNTKKITSGINAYGTILCRIFAITGDNKYIRDIIGKNDPKSKYQRQEYEELEKSQDVTVALTYKNADSLTGLIWDLSKIGD